VSASFPVGVSGSGNDATASTGSVQVGGGNTSSGSAGTVQSGPVNASPSGGESQSSPPPSTLETLGLTTSFTAASPGAATPAPAAPAGVPVQGNRTAEGAPRRSLLKALGQTKTPAGNPPVLSQLPYTGLGLLLFVLLGLGLVVSGAGTRARVGT
jgi:hypothetical protein